MKRETEDGHRKDDAESTPPHTLPPSLPPSFPTSLPMLGKGRRSRRQTKAQEDGHRECKRKRRRRVIQHPPSPSPPSLPISLSHLAPNAQAKGVEVGVGR